jgi:hypothetical protein
LGSGVAAAARVSSGVASGVKVSAGGAGEGVTVGARKVAVNRGVRVGDGGTAGGLSWQAARSTRRKKVEGRRRAVERFIS